MTFNLFQAFQAISVIKSALIMFPTFSNANRLEKAINFDCSKYMAAILDFQKGIVQNI